MMKIEDDYLCGQVHGKIRKYCAVKDIIDGEEKRGKSTHVWRQSCVQVHEQM